MRLLTQPQGTLEAVLAGLEAAASLDFRVGGEPDAETRKNVIDAFVEIVEKLELCDHLDVHWRRGVDLLTRACEDYSVDSRGDVGSWVRDWLFGAYFIFPLRLNILNRLK